jgi:hypothetical protein
MFLFFGITLPFHGIRGGRILVISNDQAQDGDCGSPVSPLFLGG